MEQAQHQHTQHELDLYAEAKFLAWNIALGHAYARNPAAFEHFKQEIGGFNFGPVREELRSKLAASLDHLVKTFDGIELRPDLDPAPPVVARQPAPVVEHGWGARCGAWMVEKAGLVGLVVLVLLMAIYGAVGNV